MSRIFISHSSKNNAHAIALRNWLIAGGWDDLFLDLDPERGIAAGERWERALNEAATRCEAVLFLVTREWLASGWCLKEFRLAGKLNKRMFGLLVDGLTIAELPPEISKDWQIVDLASGRDHTIFRAVTPNKGAEEHVHFSASGLDRLRAGLNRAGLDPRFFAWPPENDPGRPPYRGLKALEAEDAGIFFGREAQTIAALDRLRGLREAAAPRCLAILGASGAGKSSFLRAGLIPRLARDDWNFLPLPVMRAEREALSGPTGLVATLTTAVAGAKLGVTRAQVKEAVQSGASAVLALLSRLVEAKRIPPLPGDSNTAPPTLILSIDQGEELFLAEGADEAQAFLSILRVLVEAPNPAIIVIVAIRSDGYERLQSAPALEGVRQETFSLPPMPRGAFETVIEGPARRLKDVKRPLKIEPALTQTLLADIEAGGAKDALPLLAFTLERLFVDHGGDGDLTLEEYRLTGGVKGAIEAAVERAMREADGDARVPKDRSARLALIRAALIPWLAGIDPETGAPRRRVARLTEIDVECRPLIEHLVAARLLATDISPDGAVTIEPAHEALLRQWGLLQGWLEEDFAALSALDGVKRATRDWEANARDSGWLAHAAGRLEDAEEFSNQISLRNYLDESDRAYLAACRNEDNARRDRELEEAKRREADAKRIVEQQSKIVWRTRLGLIAASILFLIACSFAWYGYDRANDAEHQAMVAEERRIDAEKARKLAEEQTLRANAAAEVAESARTVADKNADEARAAKEEAQQSAHIAQINQQSARNSATVSINVLSRILTVVKDDYFVEDPNYATLIYSLLDKATSALENIHIEVIDGSIALQFAELLDELSNHARQAQTQANSLAAAESAYRIIQHLQRRSVDVDSSIALRISLSLGKAMIYQGRFRDAAEIAKAITDTPSVQSVQLQCSHKQVIDALINRGGDQVIEEAATIERRLVNFNVNSIADAIAKLECIQSLINTYRFNGETEAVRRVETMFNNDRDAIFAKKPNSPSLKIIDIRHSLIKIFMLRDESDNSERERLFVSLMNGIIGSDIRLSSAPRALILSWIEVLSAYHLQQRISSKPIEWTGTKVVPLWFGMVAELIRREPDVESNYILLRSLFTEISDASTFCAPTIELSDRLAGRQLTHLARVISVPCGDQNVAQELRQQINSDLERRNKERQSILEASKNLGIPKLSTADNKKDSSKKQVDDLSDKEIDELMNEKIYILLNGKNVFGTQIYTYIQLSLRGLQNLRNKMRANENLLPSEFGEIIASGVGFPSRALREKMKIDYNMIDVPNSVSASAGFAIEPLH